MFENIPNNNFIESFFASCYIVMQFNVRYKLFDNIFQITNDFLLRYWECWMWISLKGILLRLQKIWIFENLHNKQFVYFNSSMILCALVNFWHKNAFQLNLQIFIQACFLHFTRIFALFSYHFLLYYTQNLSFWKPSQLIIRYYSMLTSTLKTLQLNFATFFIQANFLQFTPIVKLFSHRFLLDFNEIFHSLKPPH